SLEMLVGVLGILKAGGAYVPLDAAYPRERLAFMLEDARTPVLLTQQHLVSALPEHDSRLVLLDTDWPQIDRSSARNLSAKGVTPGNLAYLIYTSGSTGRPKGVCIEHRSAVTMLRWAREVYAAEDYATVLASTSICFDLSVYELFVPLSWGGKVVLAENALQLRALPAAGEVTLVNTVPSAMAELIRMGGVPASVRTVNLAGEPLKRVLADQVYGLEHVRQVWNLYGPTEDTTYSTYSLVAKGGEQQPTIGRPLNGTQAYILDERRQMVPAGEVAELYLGGMGLARGYLRRPELTAERFIPDAFSAEPGARLYRTGDLARFRPDGELEYLGRLDHQVKVRGYRIELGEIEAVLSQHEDVRDAVVVAIESEAGEKSLAAYVVAAGRPEQVTGELRRYLRAKLPDYMVPSDFVLMEALPLTPNGKVDRRALPAPGRSRAALASEFVPPRNALEEQLAGMWAELLKVEGAGVHDNFFELGGHSLLATRLLSRMREAFHVELPQRTLFTCPTIATLAEQLQAALDAPRGSATEAPLAPLPRTAELALSFGQQRFWFVDQLEAGQSVYNVPVAVRLDGKLHVPALQHALNKVVARHESLRTTFHAKDGQPVQVVAEASPIELAVTNLEHLPEKEREAEASRLATEEAQRPFDLAAGPLVRVSLLQLSEREHVLLLTMHHIISDGWSLDVLFSELSTLYGARLRGVPSPLAPLPIQYADFAQWQRDRLQGELFEAQVSYWKRQLDGAAARLELPADRPRPAVQTYNGAVESLPLSAEFGDGLKKLSRQSGATLYMTLLAAFKVLLSRYSGQSDIVVGSPIANRNRAEIEPLIGFFVNTLVLRTDLSGDPTFEELLERVREMALDAYAHQDVPFEKLVEELQPERDLSRHPLFQVMFVLEDDPSLSLELAGTSARWMPVDNGTAKMDLILRVTETDEGLVGAVEYNTDLFDAATIKRLVDNFRVLLEGIVARPNEQISSLPLISEAERHQLLHIFNRPAASYRQDVCLTRLFEAQVERTPDAAAVSFEREQLTYSELNRRANQLARHLRELGVGPEVLVGICVERSLEMVVGLLGILKAGGAYVP
ncbi:MAG: hypothetical protein QOH49_3937, partial [Acidobacteriota bacterium]|nr:hypothetical protein [Acidobacteriota bacterium]